MSEVQAMTLTDTELKKTLNYQKNQKGLNRSVRNVLAKPFSGFWPLVDNDTELEVVTLLESLLPDARKVVTVEDRRLLRSMQGQKMKEARNAVTEKIWEKNPQARKLRSFMVLGINDVSRGLEENTLASIIISNEADPAILTRHLATLAATRHVPLIVLRQLKSSTKKCLDFSSLVIGLKKVVAEDASNYFHPIHVKIEGIFKTIAKSMLPDSCLEDIATSTTVELPQVALKSEFSEPVDIYLTRNSKTYRVFQPGKELQTKNDSSWTPYISLSAEGENKSVPLPKAPKEILGTKSDLGAFSFLQKVRDAKKGLVQLASQEIKTEEFISMSDDKPVEEANTESDNVSKPQKKPVKRYFNSLAPLKVKRIQGNPLKGRKNKKGKKK